MSPSPDVILLRSAEEPDPYVDAFVDAGLQAVCRPVLRFVFPHQDLLRERLNEGKEHYAALVATSPRVGRALEALFEEHSSLKEDWRGRTAYAVGPKTAARLQAVGLQPRGQEAGTADDLADQIVDDAPEAPLLFLCGNRRRETLPNRLRAAEAAFEELVVYETRLRTDLTLPSARWLAFFSPSGGEAVQKATNVDPTSYRRAAIGPTTAASLEEQGLSVDAVADTPSPQGLVTAIVSAQEDE